MGNPLILEDFQVIPFTLRLKTSFQKKEGLLLSAKLSGKEVFAEVSPLPGFSKETTSQAKEQLLFFKEKILKTPLEVLYKTSLFPSVAFGLDSLLHSIVPSRSYPLCGFLNGAFEEICKEIPFLLEEGYKHVKLKISQLSFNEAHCVIEKLLGKTVLKIDVNRAWNLEESLSFFSRYPLDAFEYIEEPVRDIQDLQFFPYPIALDETLREGRSSLINLPKIKAFIIKPMLMGGLKEIEEMVSLAKKMQTDITLSSSYESGVGLFHLCSLIERANISLHPLGVDTHRLLCEDLLATPHMISKGMLTLSPLEVLDVGNMVS